jgi:PIN domain nuclease of toxin-antitoxin system
MKKPKLSGPAADARHLLDTSTLLWALSTPERLSRRARNLVTAGVNVVSVASYWEVVVKTQKGLLSIADLPEWWQRATDTVRADVLPIRAAHVSALVALPAIHKDPFDRMLMAQAIAEGLTLVTSDALIKSYPVPTVW